MKLKYAMALLDGGTTAVTVERDSGEESYTFEHALPWDGRTRFVYSGGPFDIANSRQLEIDGQEELGLHEALRDLLEDRFGRRFVDKALATEGVRRKAEGQWSYALDFLFLMEKERGYGRQEDQ